MYWVFCEEESHARLAYGRFDGELYTPLPSPHAQLFVVFDQYRIEEGEGREGAELYIKIIWNNGICGGEASIFTLTEKSYSVIL